MIEYGQFCPVAKAAEILGERWTLLIVRELLLGTCRFNELQRALAKASPSILTKRLRELETANIVNRRLPAGERHYEYELTPAGEELSELIERMGVWATRWAPSQLESKDLTEYFLMLDISRRINRQRLPTPRVNLGFTFQHNNRTPKWWLIIDEERIDICDRDPGCELHLMISASLRNLTALWMGEISLKEAQAEGKVRITGDSALTKSITKWLGLSAFAGVSRPSL